mgnify:FL=1
MELENIEYFNEIEVDTPEVLLQVFDKKGQLEDIVTGYENIQSYVEGGIWKTKKKKNEKTESSELKESSKNIF